MGGGSVRERLQGLRGLRVRRHVLVDVRLCVGLDVLRRPKGSESRLFCASGLLRVRVEQDAGPARDLHDPQGERKMGVGAVAILQSRGAYVGLPLGLLMMLNP